MARAAGSWPAGARTACKASPARLPSSLLPALWCVPTTKIALGCVPHSVAAEKKGGKKGKKEKKKVEDEDLVRDSPPGPTARGAAAAAALQCFAHSVCCCVSVGCRMPAQEPCRGGSPLRLGRKAEGLRCRVPEPLEAGHVPHGARSSLPARRRPPPACLPACRCPTAPRQACPRQRPWRVALRAMTQRPALRPPLLRQDALLAELDGPKPAAPAVPEPAPAAEPAGGKGKKKKKGGWARAGKRSVWGKIRRAGLGLGAGDWSCERGAAMRPLPPWPVQRSMSAASGLGQQAQHTASGPGPKPRVHV